MIVINFHYNKSHILQKSITVKFIYNEKCNNHYENFE